MKDFNLRDNWLGLDLKELKEWVDKATEEGYKTFIMEVEWGYYNDIEGVNLKVKDKKE